MDMKLELVMVPVTDVDRAKEFYERVGFVVDHDQMVSDDADATHADLVARGIEVSEVDELAWGRFVFFADPDGNGWALQQLPDWSASAGGEGYQG
jgi:catechol 2,3-dioxygenase-like lactoylglutathione lyase family enzyme